MMWLQPSYDFMTSSLPFWAKGDSANLTVSFGLFHFIAVRKTYPQ